MMFIQLKGTQTDYLMFRILHDNGRATRKNRINTTEIIKCLERESQLSVYLHYKREYTILGSYKEVKDARLLSHSDTR